MSMDLCITDYFRPCIFFDSDEEAERAFALVEAVLGPRDPSEHEGDFEGQADSLAEVIEEVQENEQIQKFFEPFPHPENYAALYHAGLLLRRLVAARQKMSPIAPAATGPDAGL